MKKTDLTEGEWRKRLTPEQYRILRKEGTERAFTSALHEKKEKGVYKCAGCGTPLFSSDMKFDSGTGWPSFFETLPRVFETRKDSKLFRSRIEYHCVICDGHHGHVFDDGPPPTGKRYCNNGVALIFEAAEQKVQDSWQLMTHPDTWSCVQEHPAQRLPTHRWIWKPYPTDQRA